MFQKRKILQFVLLFLLLLLALGHISFFFILPHYVERKILPDLGQQLSTSLAGRVYSLGLTSADLGEINLGDPRNPALTIGQVHADYSLSSLLTSQKLNTVTVNGLRLKLVFADGKFIIPGLNLEKITSQEAAGQGPARSGAVSPSVLPSRFEINNGMLSLNYEDQHFLVPFHLLVKMDEETDISGQSAFSISLAMQPLGENISIEGRIDPAVDNGSFSLNAGPLDLGRILVRAGVSPEMISLGTGAITGTAEIGLAPLLLKEIEVAGNSDAVIINRIPLKFTAPDENIPDKKETPLFFKMKKEGDKWLIKAEAAITEPLAASLDLQSYLMMKDAELHSEGSFIFRKSGESDQENRTEFLPVFMSFPEFQGSFAIETNRNGTWQATIESSSANSSDTETLQMSNSDFNLKTSMPRFILKGSGDRHQDALELSLTSVGLQAYFNEAEIKIPRFNFQAWFRREKNQEPVKSGAGRFKVIAEAVEMKQHGFSGRADISLTGQVAQLSGSRSPYQTAGTVTIKKGQMTGYDSNLKIQTIEGNIPWQWPAADREASGQISIAEIRFDDYDLGDFKADLHLENMIYNLKGSYTGKMLTGVTADVSGQAEIGSSGVQGEAAVHIKPTYLEALQLKKFHPSLDKTYFSGLVELDGTVNFDAANLQGSVQGELRQGRLEMPEQNYSAENITMKFSLPSLPDLRSEPAQEIFFDKAKFGNLVFEDGRIIWQLESADSILIEESSLHWAGGRIFASAARLSPGMKSLTVPIFCDRLKLADLLEQFGVSNAKGEGTVSGRIPVTVGRNILNFEDGFLYSSPGQGGSVKVAAFETLAAGIPKNTPQFAQIDFAAEALKNFNYNWVKLLFNTEGEELVMQMQMDGRPAQSLPFRYDSKTGILQRIDGADKGIDQPIVLEVNFRLPLNRFLGYSGRIQDIMKKMK